MTLQIILTVLSILLLLFLTGTYKLASVESVLSVGDNSKALLIFWKTIVGFISSAIYSIDFLLEKRLDTIEDHLKAFLENLEKSTPIEGESKNDTAVH